MFCPGAMPARPSIPHQPLAPFAVDPMAQAAQVYRHFAAAVERLPRVFGVNRRQQRPFQFVRLSAQARRIDGGTGDTRPFALPGQRQWIMGADPVVTVFYRLIPDFF